jgi:two-component system sensor histidine kinase KdpD
MKTQKPINGLTIEQQYFFSTVILFFFITILYIIQDTIGYETVSIILLLIIFLLPLFNFSKGPIVLSALISALAWDYYFIPPHFTMHIAKTEDAVMLFMFFIVAVTNGVLTSRINVQKNKMLSQERRLSAKYNLVKDLSHSNNIDDLLSKVVGHIRTVFGSDSVIFFPENSDRLNRTPHPSSNFETDEMEYLAAQAAYKGKTDSGRFTNVVGNTDAMYTPFFDKAKNVVCVLGIRISEGVQSNSAELKFLREFISDIAPFLEK